MKHPINIDLILRILLNELREATKGWLRGNPSSEEAFLNRITEVLAKNRRCDVGLEESYGINVEHYTLHRKGKNQTDRFGSDLAVTVSIPDKKFIKTCMFQLKKSEGYRAAIEKHQINEASIFNPIKQRSFILTVDYPRGEIKINSINEVAKDFPKDQDTRTFDCSDWDPLSDWVIKWLKCEVGAGNRPNDPMAIEKLLESQLKEQSDREFDNTSFEIPNDYKLTKNWFEFTFNKKTQ